MAETSMQPKVAKATPSPEIRNPRWGKRLLESLKIAGAATFLAGALTFSSAGCSNVQIRLVVPASAYYSASQEMPNVNANIIPNPILDPKVGVVYHRPDGMDAILTKPDLYGDPLIPQAVPFLYIHLLEVHFSL